MMKKNICQRLAVSHPDATSTPPNVRNDDRFMASDDESSWHSAMDLLEQRQSSSTTQQPVQCKTDDSQQTSKKKKTTKPKKANKPSTQPRKAAKQAATRRRRSSTSSQQSDQSQCFLSEDDLQPDTIATSGTSLATIRRPTRPTSTACAKMLVRAGYRCPCHFLRECPSIVFSRKISLCFKSDSE